jgi:hypothetical protein
MLTVLGICGVLLIVLTILLSRFDPDNERTHSIMCALTLLHAAATGGMVVAIINLILKYPIRPEG